MATDEGLDTVHDWTDPAGRRWEVEVVSHEIDGRYEVVDLRIAAPEGQPPQRLTRETVKALPLGQISDDHRRWLRDEYGPAVLQTEPTADVVARIRSDLTKLGGRRGSRLTNEELQRVADVYRSTPHGESVVETVAAVFVISASAAAKRIRAARDAGLLAEPNRRTR